MRFSSFEKQTQLGHISSGRKNLENSKIRSSSIHKDSKNQILINCIIKEKKGHDAW